MLTDKSLPLLLAICSQSLNGLGSSCMSKGCKCIGAKFFIGLFLLYCSQLKTDREIDAGRQITSDCGRHQLLYRVTSVESSSGESNGTDEVAR